MRELIEPRRYETKIKFVWFTYSASGRSLGEHHTGPTRNALSNSAVAEMTSEINQHVNRPDGSGDDPRRACPVPLLSGLVTKFIY